MSYVDELLSAYGDFISLPWSHSLAGPQRVLMAVYPPEHERRLRLHLPAFKEATNAHNHPWALIDITTSFERWMAAHDYREAYFAAPKLLVSALGGFFTYLADDVRSQLAVFTASDGVVALLGAGALFGLGDAIKVSALINAVNGAIAGRLLVFFPGHQEGSNYRLLDARDGWNYLAVPIAPKGGTQ